MAERKVKVLILGSGPAGATAAIYTARGGLKPVMMHGIQPGGQMTITTDVENYPGFESTIQGPWLMEQFTKQAEHMGTEIVNDQIAQVDLSKRPFRLTAESGDVYLADVLIIATGASAKWLGLPSEKKYQGFGVSGCATCDGPFFRKKDVLVVGGGNTAVEEALFLSGLASHVTIIHRRDKFRSEKILQDRLLAKPNVKVLWDTELKEVLGDEDPKGVTGARVINAKTGKETDIKVHGVFIAIGHKPNTDFLKNSGLKFDDEGYLITIPGSTRTNIEGVFAAGDVQDKIFRQAVTAAGTGCMAALETKKFLEGH